MSDIVITPVASRGDLKKFIAFPNRLFKDVPSYIPPLDSEERKLLTDKNPSLEHCSRELFLARRGGKVVGRVAAIINRRANATWQKQTVRFGWIDFVDDEDVSRALIDTVAAWGRERGMTEMEGPLGFTDMDAEGMLTEGFDQLSTMATIYNYPYYPQHMERLGLTKAMDWIEMKLMVPPQVPDKYVRIAEIVKQNEGKGEFICGGEESYGFNVGEFVRDKDAQVACSILAECAAWAKGQGLTIYQLMQKVYAEFGYRREALKYLVRKGKTGVEEIAAMMTGLRANPPADLAGAKVVKVIDYLEPEKTGLPKSNVLQFFSEAGDVVSVRPSGTEPKIKFYFGAAGADADAKVALLEKQFIQ